eukprot:5307307-Prymnesium_polylepis.1
MHSITACASIRVQRAPLHLPLAHRQGKQSTHQCLVTEGVRLRHAASRVCHRPVCCGDGTYGLPPTDVR